MPSPRTIYNVLIVTCLAAFVMAGSLRQVTRQQLERESLMRSRTNARAALAPRASSAPYETCSATNTGSGYATYLSYNDPQDNLNPAVAQGNVSACQAYCESLSGCVGFAWAARNNNLNNKCQPKQNIAAVRSNLQPSNVWDMYIMGTCDAGSSSTSANCCNSRAYPICTSTGVGQGYATFETRNSPNNNLNDVQAATSAADCRAKCTAAGSSCIGFAWLARNTNLTRRCSLKMNRPSTARGIQDYASAWDTYIQGTCSQLAQYTAQTCCDSPQ